MIYPPRSACKCIRPIFCSLFSPLFMWVLFAHRSIVAYSPRNSSESFTSRRLGIVDKVCFDCERLPCSPSDLFIDHYHLGGSFHTTTKSFPRPLLLQLSQLSSSLWKIRQTRLETSKREKERERGLIPHNNIFGRGIVHNLQSEVSSHHSRPSR